MRAPRSTAAVQPAVPRKILLGYGVARGVHGLVRDSASGPAPTGSAGGRPRYPPAGAGLAGGGDADRLERGAGDPAEGTARPCGAGFLSWAIGVGVAERARAGASGPGAGLITDSDVERGRHAPDYARLTIAPTGRCAASRMSSSGSDRSCGVPHRGMTGSSEKLPIRKPGGVFRRDTAGRVRVPAARRQ